VSSSRASSAASTPAASASSSSATGGGRKALIAVLYLGFLAGVQSSDPNINSSALLRAATELKMGNSAALAASIGTLFLAATAITTGMMGDRLGRRRVLIFALAFSAAGDLIVMAAPDTPIFLLGRIIAGIGLGAVYGASFAFLKEFATGKGGLSAAMGTYMASGGAAAVLIVFAGSSLAGIDWRLAYVVIPVLCILSIPAALAITPGGGEEKSKAPWDAPGQVLLALSIIFTLGGLSHASDKITSPLTFGPIIVGVLLFAAFYVWERDKGEAGFFPIGLFKNPVFIAAILCGLVYNLTYGTTLISFTNLFQYANKATGMELSLAQLPFLVAGIAGALIAGKLRGSGKLSRRGAVMLGAIVCSIGFVLFAITAAGRPASVWAFTPAMLLSGAGIIIASVPYGGMILQEAPANRYGPVASSRLTIGQFWFAVGLAGSTVMMDTITRSKVQEKLGASAGSALEKFSVSGTKPSNPEVLRDAAFAYSDAFAEMMIVLTVVPMVAAIATFLILRKAARGEGDDIAPPVSPSFAVAPSHVTAPPAATSTSSPATQSSPAPTQ